MKNELYKTNYSPTYSCKEDSKIEAGISNYNNKNNAGTVKNRNDATPLVQKIWSLNSSKSKGVVKNVFGNK